MLEVRGRLRISRKLPRKCGLIRSFWRWDSSAAVGVIFGVWPARRAAALDPIVAFALRMRKLRAYRRRGRREGGSPWGEPPSYIHSHLVFSSSIRSRDVSEVSQPVAAVVEPVAGNTGVPPLPVRAHGENEARTAGASRS